MNFTLPQVTQFPTTNQKNDSEFSSQTITRLLGLMQPKLLNSWKC